MAALVRVLSPSSVVTSGELNSFLSLNKLVIKISTQFSRTASDAKFTDKLFDLTVVLVVDY